MRTAIYLDQFSTAGTAFARRMAPLGTFVMRFPHPRLHQPASQVFLLTTSPSAHRYSVASVGPKSP